MSSACIATVNYKLFKQNQYKLAGLLSMPARNINMESMVPNPTYQSSGDTEDPKSTYQSLGDTEDYKSIIKDETNDYNHINARFEETNF